MNKTIKMNIDKICDGIVIIRNFLEINEQNILVDKIINPMVLNKVFCKEELVATLNVAEHKGRFYCNLDYFKNDKQYLMKMCKKMMEIIDKVDKTINNSVPTHLLSLYYKTDIGCGGHKDNGGNDGDLDKPVISLSIGNSCLFEMHEITDSKPIKRAFQLNSGDVLIFGGPQRLAWHRVTKVLLDSAPLELKLIDKVRINLTFRDSTSVMGNEDYYSTENYMARQTQINLERKNKHKKIEKLND